MFRKVLVANRGEIACRIFATCRRLGIRSVAVCSDADASAAHVAAADEAVRIGPAPVRESYLDAGAVIRAALETGAQAVHPGYGLLSERGAFARQVIDAGLVFVGPPPDALEALGDKVRARDLARSVGVEPPPGTPGPVAAGEPDAAVVEARRIGFPVLVKAVGGGGGIGMQIAADETALLRALRSCSDRARSAFGDERVYLERYLERPRHIEVQVLCDAAGGAIALGERECSVQRRHQKIVEETPSPAAFLRGPQGEAKRERLHASALALVRAAGYRNAGTVEFVADAGGRLFFLEVNARLQVEHPVTEMVTGLDLVEMQLRVASGELSVAELGSPSRTGHAVEARVYAEDPKRMFAPQPGRIARLEWPSGGLGGRVRVDAGVREGDEITPHYDPMIAKVIAHGSSREEAVRLLTDALGATRLEVVGPRGPAATNLELLREVLVDPRFASGDYDTHLVEQMTRAPRPAGGSRPG
jgi:acetyl-CoA carboxylase biotin carboxylase subunit/3-methylcrotonyl-CoA carboxylase alpha subunit